MAACAKTGLQKIAQEDGRTLRPFHEDGVTHGNLTWIWFVAVGNAL